MPDIKIAVIGGSGLDDTRILKNTEEITLETPFGQTSSPLINGEIAGHKVVVLARHGKNHTILPTKVPFRANLWALKQVGCTHILATTACGSLREEIKPRDLVFIDQFIDFTKHRPLTFHEKEVVHTAMAEPFCPFLRRILSETAKEMGVPHHDKGTIITIEGPRFSTGAESRMFRTWGADVINMSTVPEVVLARELKICYASIAMATDYDSWREGEDSVTFEMVLEVMKLNAENVKKILLAVIPRINFVDCPCCG
ncbi:MAG: S-methyl-5'-thioadenosine phosphorylase [Candidatus Magasanikbacteria bacterium]|nr:S-methyl-5'-thioadenosine phosphorylase [Candidatus Magasanikbacteria bacterium]